MRRVLAATAGGLAEGSAASSSGRYTPVVLENVSSLHREALSLVTRQTLGYDTSASNSLWISPSSVLRPLGATRISPALGAIHLATRRFAHWEERGAGPNLLQDCDTNDIDASIRAVTYLEQAATPAFTFGAHLSPAQASSLLQRLPRVLHYQHGRRRPAADQTLLLAALLDATGARLAAVAARCRLDELARGLWAFGALRRDHPKLFEHASARITFLLPKPRPLKPPRLAATGAPAANANHLSPKQPTAPARTLKYPTSTKDLATLAWAFAARLPEAHQTGNQAMLQAIGDTLAVRPLKEFDHRSVCKLSWALARANLRHEPLLERLAAAASAQIREQLAKRTPGTWLETNTWEEALGIVKRGYLRNQDPFVTVKDFEYGTLASLLRAMGKLNYRNKELAKAAAAHVIAAAGTGATGNGTELMVPVRQPSRHAVVRMLSGLYRQGYRNREAVEAALAHAPLTQLGAAKLVAVLHIAVKLGARDPLLLRRLARVLHADEAGTSELGQRQLVALVMAYLRADYHDPAIQQRVMYLISKLVASGTARMAARAAALGDIFTPTAVAGLSAAINQFKGLRDRTPMAQALVSYMNEMSSGFEAVTSAGASEIVKLLASSKDPNLQGLRRAFSVINLDQLSMSELRELRKALEQVNLGSLLGAHGFQATTDIVLEDPVLPPARQVLPPQAMEQAHVAGIAAAKEAKELQGHKV